MHHLHISKIVADRRWIVLNAIDCQRTAIARRRVAMDCQRIPPPCFCALPRWAHSSIDSLPVVPRGLGPPPLAAGAAALHESWFGPQVHVVIFSVRAWLAAGSALASFSQRLSVGRASMEGQKPIHPPRHKFPKKGLSSSPQQYSRLAQRPNPSHRATPFN